MGNFQREHYEAVKDYISVGGFELKVKLPFESSLVHPIFDDFATSLSLSFSKKPYKVRLSEFDSFYFDLKKENFGVKGKVLTVFADLHIPFEQSPEDWESNNGYTLRGKDLFPIPNEVPSPSKYLRRLFEGLHVQPFTDRGKPMERILYELWPDKCPAVEWTPPVREVPKKKGLLARIMG